VKVLVVGAGGVGSAFVRIAARRGSFSSVVIADFDHKRAQLAAQSASDSFSSVQLNASDESSIAELLRAGRFDAVLNAVDPRFVMPIYRAALSAGVTYVDMAMSLSHPHSEDPFQKTGIKLGDEQFALSAEWERSGLLALVGIGVEPGLSDVFARYAADNLFSAIDEVGIRDGANLVVDGYRFCPPSKSA
jgi:saccharopine dehydrogenase (NAD+, L-lysine-forming)